MTGSNSAFDHFIREGDRLERVAHAQPAYSRTQVKLAAEFSVPAAPVNFGHLGHSQSGRARLASGFPSMAVRPLGACPFSTQFCSATRLSNLALNFPYPWAKPGIT